MRSDQTPQSTLLACPAALNTLLSLLQAASTIEMRVPPPDFSELLTSNAHDPPQTEVSQQARQAFRARAERLAHFCRAPTPVPIVQDTASRRHPQHSTSLSDPSSGGPPTRDHDATVQCPASALPSAGPARPRDAPSLLRDSRVKRPVTGLHSCPEEDKDG